MKTEHGSVGTLKQGDENSKKKKARRIESETKRDREGGGSET